MHICIAASQAYITIGSGNDWLEDCCHLGPLLLTSINYNLNMDK